MKSINVNRSDLITKVQDNRAKHVAEFNEAIDAWKAKQIEQIERARKLLTQQPADAPFNLYGYAAQQPTSQVADYDRALEMLSMSVDDVVTITQEEFRQLVLDEWQWQAGFKTVTASYIGRK